MTRTFWAVAMDGLCVPTGTSWRHTSKRTAPGRDSEAPHAREPDKPAANGTDAGPTRGLGTLAQ